MRLTSIAALAALFSLAAAGPAPAAMSKEQAKKHCAAIHGGRAGVQKADRTGITVQQAIAKCVAAKTGGK